MTPLRVALVGNPNCGKTALFNRLTGSRQKVANYAGVTVERKEGRRISPQGRELIVLDLPGTYSLEATSPDEAITRDVCLGRLAGEPPPDVIVCVVDATNLRLHLRFALELRALGRPMVLVLNLADAARKRGISWDLAGLAQRLGLPVVETVAVVRHGADALLQVLDGPVAPAATTPLEPADDLHGQVRALMAATVRLPSLTARIDEQLDRVTLHPVGGLVLLTAIMFLIFQAVFSWAEPPKELIEAGVGALGGWLGDLLPAGMLRSLVVDALIAGVGGVLVFLPQILLLFFFILVLEESGYLPRAAFLLDRTMTAVGLSGRAFIPLLSSYACAIPGIMATRSIQDPRDRLTTILVAPLTTCSARLPVYTLLIAALFPDREVWIFNLRGIVLFCLYVLGIVAVVVVAWVMKWLRRDVGEHALLLELPSYRLPNVRDVALGLYERGIIFLRRVGGIILAMTVLLWFLANFPAPPDGATQPAIEYSLAGRLGHALQVIFEPVGFNWQICIALVPGMAAREVAITALGTVYALSGEGTEQALEAIVASQWSTATAFSFLAWYVFAPQCLSTLAVIRRETGSWRQMFLAAGYLFALAWLASFATYQIVRVLT